MNTQESKSANCHCVLLCSKELNQKDKENKFQLLQLPYAENALEPYISQKTVQFHYGKHLKGYVDNTNTLKAGTEFDHMPIEEIILHSSGKLFNNAAQTFNHYFQFEAFRPYDASKAEPQGKLKKAIEESFGSIDAFKKKFSEAALAVFGSGYAWVIADANHKLEIIQTANAATPITEGKKPIMNLDVWEHAYYLDVQNLRAKYIENVWNVMDWEKVEKRLFCNCSK